MYIYNCEVSNYLGYEGRKRKEQGLGTPHKFLRKLLAVLCVVLFVFAVFSVGIVFVVAGPPSSGDWIITGTESYSDQVIVLNGNLIVENGGNLTLKGVTLKMKCHYDGEYSISVNGGGKFYVLDGSVITSVAPENEYVFTVHDGATLRMMNSELHECGWESGMWQTSGLQINTDDAVIEDSLISHNNLGIEVHTNGTVVRNNNITANDRFGIAVAGGKSIIYGNYISRNKVFGINAAPGSSPTIYNNTIELNWVGIYFWGGANPIIRDNVIRLNNASGILFSEGSSPTIINNIITSNFDTGISFKNSVNPIIQGNNITANNGTGISATDSNAIIQNNTISSNDDGVWLDYSGSLIEYNTIFSNRHDEIVAKNSNVTIRQNSITGSHVSAINCWNYSIATIEENNISNIDGNAISCHSFSSGLIRSNYITSSITGIRCTNNSNPTIENNLITNNNEGIILERSSPFIYGNTITSARGYSGLSIGDGSNATVQNNSILWNQIGIEIHSNSTPTIQANKIMENTVVGVKFVKWSAGNLQGNRIIKNSEGVLLKAYSAPMIQGNIITFNDGNGIRCEDKSSPEVHGNDIYSNRGYGIVNLDPSIGVKAIKNYWGGAAGPVQSLLTDGADPEEVSQYVLYNPWLTESIIIAEIIKPLSGETVPATVTVSIDARAKNGINKVEFYIDDQLKYVDLDWPYEWNWNTTQYTETSHNISAVAYDIFGLTTKVSRTVFVDNTDPIVLIEEPKNGTTYCGVVTISVNATDNREVSSVRVIVDGGQPLIMAYNPIDSLWKYDLNTTTLSDSKEHTIMILALDKAANLATTSITIFTDNTPPTLTIQTPQSGITVGLILIVSVQANDTRSGMSRVEFYLTPPPQSALVSTVTTLPYQWAWDTTRYPNGAYTITVKAYDTIGNFRSRDIAVTVNNVQVPWWEANFWAIMQVLIGLIGLALGIVTIFWSRERKKKKRKEEMTNVSPQENSGKQD